MCIFDGGMINLDTLFKLGIVIVVGLLGGKLARKFKLPNVTGYLLAGLLLGPSFFKLISNQDTQAFSIISEFALACIAFSIGNEFVIKELRKLGKSIVIITFAEVIGAIGIVFFVTYVIFKQPFAFSIVIASMSAATAPAATLMVMRQYRARGPLTQTILPVVALDDVYGIIAFGIAISLAKITTGGANYSILQMFTQPLVEVVGSLVLGAIMGFLLVLTAGKASDKEELLSLVLAVIAATTGMANWLNLSSLLACIMVGTMLVNLKPNPSRVFLALNDFTPPVYLLFFTLAGASLDLSILFAVGLLGIAYIFARAAGKMLGAWVGAKSVNAPDTVRKYLGLALLPQGGISIGLSVLVRQQLPEYAVAITTIIMFSVLVYETTGPIFAKIAIDQAGEIGGMDRAENQGPVQVSI